MEAPPKSNTVITEVISHILIRRLQSQTLRDFSEVQNHNPTTEVNLVLLLQVMKHAMVVSAGPVLAQVMVALFTGDVAAIQQFKDNPVVGNLFEEVNESLEELKTTGRISLEAPTSLALRPRPGVPGLTCTCALCHEVGQVSRVQRPKPCAEEWLGLMWDEWTKIETKYGQPLE